MTINTEVECNRCGDKEKPPKNAGMLVLMVTAPDGMNLSDSLGHLCIGCRHEVMRDIRLHREALDRAKGIIQ
jgi:hypothetical protein